MNEVEWADHTTAHPLALVLLAVLGLATLAVPRRYALVPLIVMTCAVSARQRIVVAGLDFTFLRLLVLTGWFRVVVRGEGRVIRLHGLDYALIATVLVTAVSSTIRMPSSGILIFNLGTAFDSLGFYFVARMLVRDWGDIRTIVGAFAIIVIPMFGFFVFERLTRHNLFSVFGGVPAITVIREGKLRCQGPFSHPILAGCFWASLIPLFVAEWWRGANGKRIAVASSAAAVGIVILSASSTPLSGVVAGVVGAVMFQFRARMQLVRRALAVTLLFLHLAMDAPVWHLISRIDLVGGSTGWHRYHLIDQAVRHFSEWALIGINSTSHWGHLTGDLANQYILVGVRGGVIALVSFIAAISFGFSIVGRSWRKNRRSPVHLMRSWALGVSLFTHVMMFLAVSYFGQAVMIWYLLLAMVRSVGEFPRPAQPSAARKEVREEPVPEADPEPHSVSLGAGLRSAGARTRNQASTRADEPRRL